MVDDLELRIENHEAKGQAFEDPLAGLAESLRPRTVAIRGYTG